MPRLEAAKKLAVFLDFDGTLVPLRLRTEAAKIDPDTRGVLWRLAWNPNVKIYIISGRRRSDLRRAVAIPGVTCIGLHGWEVNGSHQPSVESQRVLGASFRALARQLSGLPQIIIHKKGACYEIHYRGASGVSVRRAHGLIHQVIEPFSPRLRVLHGHKIWEILPSEIEGKGAAVRSRLAASAHSPLPIYVGDDTSDESAFKVLRDGITVRVGRRRPTEARYELSGPAEVSQFLKRLLAAVL